MPKPIINIIFLFLLASPLCFAGGLRRRVNHGEAATLAQATAQSEDFELRANNLLENFEQLTRERQKATILEVAQLKHSAETELDPRAMEKLLDLYKVGKLTSTFFTAELAAVYRRAFETSDAIAQCNLGRLHEVGLGVPKDETEAIRLYRLAIEKGNPAAQFLLGQLYESGVGVPQDYAEMIRLWKLSAEQGYAPAQINLVNEYRLGLHAIAPEDAEVFELLLLAAEQEGAYRARAQVNLGAEFYSGEIVERNFPAALSLYTQAAADCRPVALFNLAIMYRDGNGVRQDDVKAIRWMKLAAHHNYAIAIHELGQKYEFGFGVTMDLAEAIRYYRIATRKGHTDSIYALGTMHRDGKGLEKNLLEARRLFRIAAAQNSSKAIEALRDFPVILERPVSITANSECSICIQSFMGGELSITTLPCSHSFHQPCLNQSIRSTGRKCPLCRGAIPAEE